jgi:hypothetical protein
MPINQKPAHRDGGGVMPKHLLTKKVLAGAKKAAAHEWIQLVPYGKR